MQRTRETLLDPRMSRKINWFFQTCKSPSLSHVSNSSNTNRQSVKELWANSACEVEVEHLHRTYKRQTTPARNLIQKPNDHLNVRLLSRSLRQCPISSITYKSSQARCTPQVSLRAETRILWTRNCSLSKLPSRRHATLRWLNWNCQQSRKVMLSAACPGVPLRTELKRSTHRWTSKTMAT